MAFYSNIPTESSHIQVLFVGREICKPSHAFGPAVRDYTLVHYCLSGKGMFQNEHGVYRVRQGQIFIIREGEKTIYTADPVEPWSYVWIAFRGRSAARMRELSAVISYPHATFHEISDGIERGASNDFYYSKLYEMLAHLFTKTKNHAPPEAIAKRLMEESYMEEISIEALATTLGFDRNHLTRRFKAAYGETPKAYLTHVRIEKAKSFLTQGSTVSETAALVGYSDVLNFSKMFKNVVGTSPKQYQCERRLKKNQSAF